MLTQSAGCLEPCILSENRLPLPAETHSGEEDGVWCEESCPVFKGAAKRGLNPNIWFNNVEVVASEKIGRVTVQYVSNIYKYYLAYQMIEEQRAEREKAKES